MTEFDSIVLKLRILEASIEADELCDAVRSPQTRARLLKIRDTLDDALGVLRKYSPDARPTIPSLQDTSASQRGGA
ncbi:hypothetical protein [Burkholderia humptydooensis]|uniref:hypothetical protein n=1 Tax=Burkholderia humptydooensis TaxID=430531 RepID=UPI001428AE2E|nr:hypothetical protein [Burkholderia humptydooensis]